MQDHTIPFGRWSPFGLLPFLLWPVWAAPLLPDHFEEARADLASRSADIVDFAAYRQRRLERGRSTVGQPSRAFEG